MSITTHGETLGPDLEARWRRIAEKIEANHHWFRGQGTLAVKSASGRCYVRLRYFERLDGGRVVHRAIHVGADPELVRRTRRLLDRLRARKAWDAETAALVRCIGVASAALRQGVVRLQMSRQQAGRRAARPP